MTLEDGRDIKGSTLGPSAQGDGHEAIEFRNGVEKRNVGDSSAILTAVSEFVANFRRKVDELIPTHSSTLNL